MEVTIDRGALVKALDPVVKASGGPKSPAVALRCVRVTIDEDGAKLAATRLEQHASAHVDGKVKSGGDTIVDASLLLAAVKKLGAGDVKISGGDRQVTITSGKTSVRLPCAPGADHPPLGQPAEGGWFALPPKALEEALAAHYAADPASKASAHSCVLLEAQGRTLLGVALQNAIMVTHRVRLEHDVGSWRAVVPLGALPLLAEACRSDALEIAIDAYLYARAEGGPSVATKLLDDAFPPHGELFKLATAGVKTKVRARRVDLARAIETALLVLSPEQPITLSAREGLLRVEATSDRGKTDDELSVDHEGPAVLRTSLGSSFVRDAIAQQTADEIVLGFGATALDPMLVFDAEQTRVAICMPQRVPDAP